MKYSIFNSLILAILVAGCAVSANEFAPAALPTFERAASPINERYSLQVANPAALFLQAEVLGNTCSAVRISGDFQDRFNQLMDSALASVFTGGAEASAATVSITVAPDTPRVRMLRRTYITGDARIDFAMAADIVVTRADGGRQTLRVSTEATRATASEETATCDGAARALARAFDESATKMANEMRQAITAAPPPAQ